MLNAEDASTLDARLLGEIEWLGDTELMVGSESPDYLSRRLSSDRSRKSRGYKSRTQGGEVISDAE